MAEPPRPPQGRTAPGAKRLAADPPKPRRPRRAVLYDDELDALRELDEMTGLEFCRWAYAWRLLGLQVDGRHPPCVFARGAVNDLRHMPQGRRGAFAQELASALHDSVRQFEVVRYLDTDIYRWRRGKRTRVLLQPVGGRWCVLAVFLSGHRRYVQMAGKTELWRFYLYAIDGSQIEALEGELKPHQARQWAQAQLGKVYKRKRVESVRVHVKKRLLEHIFIESSI